MSRRFLLIASSAFLICVALIFLTAYGVGADPLHPRSRHIWGLSLIAAAYASIRLAMIAGKILDARNDADEPSMFGLFRKREHAIDRRLEARRARLEAAKKKRAAADERETAE
ncbi:MAG: hypothetical protein AAGA72_01690 [Pseudomonadota bacterium]